MAFHIFFYGGDTPADTAEASRLRRRLSRHEADAAISFLLAREPGRCSLPELAGAFGAGLAEDLLAAGVLRAEGDSLWLDCPLFLQKDLDCLRQLTSREAEAIAGALDARRPQMARLLAPLRNGFPLEVNLYHLLCGRIFDGLYFDYLEAESLISTGRERPSGFTDLVICYEDAPALGSWIRSLLCSYNRYGTREGVFQSFGDCAGRRLDFYRAAQQPGRPSLPPLSREQLVRAFIALADGRTPGRAAMDAFTFFGYAREGRPCVPVYREDLHRPLWEELFQLVLSATAAPVREALSRIGGCPDLTPNRHRVPLRDTANEVFHLLFGQVNGALVQRGLTAPPEDHGLQGRYRKSFEILSAGRGGQSSVQQATNDKE